MSLKNIAIVGVLGLSFGFGLRYFQHGSVFGVGSGLGTGSFGAGGVPRGPSNAAGVQGKSSSPFQIQITAPAGFLYREGSDIPLTASVKVLRQFSGDVDFNWILPPGVVLVDGDEEDSIAGLQAGQTFERKIVIQGLSKEDASQLVVLQVSSEEGGVRIGGAGSFSTAKAEKPILAGGVQATDAGEPDSAKSLPKHIQQ